MFRILEIIWLLIGLAGIGFCIYALIQGDKDQAIYFLIFTFIAGIMFSVRRRQRKREEQTRKNNSTLSKE